MDAEQDFSMGGGGGGKMVHGSFSSREWDQQEGKEIKEQRTLGEPQCGAEKESLAYLYMLSKGLTTYEARLCARHSAS